MLGIHRKTQEGSEPIAAHEHVPKAMGTSPKMVPGTRQPSVFFDAVEQLDDLDLAGENHVERSFAPLVNGEFSGAEMPIGRGRREKFRFGDTKRREQRNGPDIVDGQHRSLYREDMSQV